MGANDMVERWAEIKAAFVAASALGAEEREAYLEEVCADETVRQEVRALLTAHDREGPVDRLLSDIMAPLRTSALATSREGQRIDSYEVMRELGRGGMGRVYEARDVRLDRTVALKFLSPHRSADVEMKGRFRREARAASALDHPNICTIYDIGETETNDLYIAMAYYDGTTLAERLKQGPLPIEEAVNIARQVAEGLACAHEAGITHRDLKPSNLMLTERGLMKMLDFGIAKLDGERTQTRSGTRLGTVAYMAPEQVRGEPVGPPADRWALGVVLYEMLAGRRPFLADTTTALLYAVLEEEPPPLATLRPDVPESTARLVDRLLSKAPADRYQRTDDVVDALSRFGAEVAVPRVHPRELPTSLTSFVGRGDEIGRLERLLDQARLVTLTGPAGTGKTRLALQFAAGIEDEFSEGVAFVSLASVTDAGLVVTTIAQALGTPVVSASSPLEHLKEALRDRELLLILDNFEQVVAAASAVAELLAACPALKVLVTSRVALHVRGEHEFPVPPLALSNSGSENRDTVPALAAVQLFVERAQAVRPDFTLDDENTPIVAELCRRLDGLPLAIELAAARIKLFPPRAMLMRLGRRFELLKGGSRDMPARHKTLRQAIAWSYDLLSSSQQQLLQRMAVCVGGSSLEAVQALAGVPKDAVVDDLFTLVDHSFVDQEEGPDGEPRFTMLETLRAYGEERLEASGELAAMRERHALHYLELAERAAEELTGAAQAGWFDRLELEHGNLRAALRWAESERVADIGVRLGAALWRFWIACGHFLEGRRWLDRLRTMPVAPSVIPARAHLLNGLGTIAHNQGDNDDARAYLEESLALWRSLDDEQGTALVLNNLAWVACEVSDLDRAERLAREAEAMCQVLDDRRGLAVALNNLGWVANYRGEYRTAKTFHEKGLDLRRALGDQRGIAFALMSIAWAEAYHGSYEAAAACADQAFTLTRRLKDTVLHSAVFVAKGYYTWLQGQFDEAASALQNCLSLWFEGSNKSLRAWALAMLGGICLDQQLPDRADECLREGLALWRSVGGRWGESMALFEQGRVAQHGGDHERALDRYGASWRLRHAMKSWLGMAECLEALATVEMERGDPIAAVQQLAAAQALRDRIDVPLPLYRREGFEAHKTRLQEELGAEAFERAWHGGAIADPGEIAERAFGEQYDAS